MAAYGPPITRQPANNQGTAKYANNWEFLALTVTFGIEGFDMCLGLCKASSIYS